MEKKMGKQNETKILAVFGFKTRVLVGVGNSASSPQNRSEAFPPLPPNGDSKSNLEGEPIELLCFRLGKGIKCWVRWNDWFSERYRATNPQRAFTRHRAKHKQKILVVVLGKFVVVIDSVAWLGTRWSQRSSPLTCLGPTGGSLWVFKRGSRGGGFLSGGGCATAPSPGNGLPAADPGARSRGVTGHMTPNPFDPRKTPEWTLRNQIGNESKGPNPGQVKWGSGGGNNLEKWGGGECRAT